MTETKEKKKKKTCKRRKTPVTEEMQCALLKLYKEYGSWSAFSEAVKVSGNQLSRWAHGRDDVMTRQCAPQLLGALKGIIPSQETTQACVDLGLAISRLIPLPATEVVTEEPVEEPVEEQAELPLEDVLDPEVQALFNMYDKRTAIIDKLTLERSALGNMLSAMGWEM